MEQDVRRCPGERYEIALSICRARQQHYYPKCANCPHSEIVYKKEPTKTVRASDTPGVDVPAGIFKSYDIRGTYPDQINEEVARKIGQGFAQFIKAEAIVVGRDMRKMAEPIAAALAEGITLTGTDVIDIGLVSTECTYFAVAHYGYGGAAMTTASHNPPEWIGFKLSRENAVPISYETGIANIERNVLNGLLPPALAKGKVTQRDVLEDYVRHVLTFAEELRPLRVVVDAGNGMAGKTVPLVAPHLPCEIIGMYFKPDGSFPNHEANPLRHENLRDLQTRVRERGADVGVAFDGDADRCVFVDEGGDAVACDIVTALLARHVLSKHPNAPIVYDLRSSWAVCEEITAAGGKPVRERVGHAHIKARMRKEKAAFGGELSGHYYFRDNYYADSGLIAMIEMLNLLSAADVPLSKLVGAIKRYHATGEINFTVENPDAKLRQIKSVFSDGRIDELDGVTVEYDDWWFNVRKSNTEPLLRLNLEGRTHSLMNEGKERVVKVIREP